MAMNIKLFPGLNMRACVFMMCAFMAWCAPEASAQNIVKRVIDYFGQSNQRKEGRGLDFSLIGGPYYNSDMGAGIGLVASGLYGSTGVDTIQPPSNVSFFGKVSTKGFAELGLEGTHVGHADKLRITYQAEFFTDPSDYWGIGYVMGNNDANKSSMKRIGFRTSADFLWRVFPGLYAGPGFAVNYLHPYDIEDHSLLDGQHPTIWSQGVGVSVVYDTRDVLTNPHNGIYARVSQCVRPRFLGNKYCFWTTEMKFNTYHSVWSGGIVATDVRGDFNYGNPSWNMMAEIGGTSFMRGYYQGRYRDKCMMAAQVELRQHVYRRSGVVVWGGVATVFRRFSDVQFDRLLPNYGLGYRWEFKKDVNVRVDVGFGKKGQYGVMFSVNEAF